MNEDLKKEFDSLIEKATPKNSNKIYEKCKKSIADFQFKWRGNAYVQIDYDVCIGYIIGKLRF